MPTIMHLILFLYKIQALTLIIPKNHLNHRLSYANGLTIVNSAVHEQERAHDYFNLPEEFTYLEKEGKVLCLGSNEVLNLCQRSENPVMWKIINVSREVRFKSAYNNCLTVGKYSVSNDSFSVVSKGMHRFRC